MKEETEKVGLKLNIQKTKIMASSLITSWQIDVEIMETVTDCIFLGSIITMDGDMSLSQLWEMVIDREAWRAAVWNQSVSSRLVLTVVS